MNRGYVKTWRKLVDSTIFANARLLKLFLLCLCKATHKPIEVAIPGILNPIKLEPGQFITGRNSLHEDYHQAHLRKNYRRKAAPTAITLYRWLLTLQNMQILNIKTFNKYSIITMLNWELYQENEQQMNNRRTTNEHKQEQYKHKKENADSFFEISELRNRYPNQQLIDQVFTEIASTRKCNRVKESVLIAQLKKWERYPVEQVETGIKTYLEKNYAVQGKNEAYLLGIIHNGKPALQSSKEQAINLFQADWY